MIGCDNDLCSIEWFRSTCVQLTSKPKGKWFCPRCRSEKMGEDSDDDNNRHTKMEVITITGVWVMGTKHLELFYA